MGGIDMSGRANYQALTTRAVQLSAALSMLWSGVETAIHHREADGDIENERGGWRGRVWICREH